MSKTPDRTLKDIAKNLESLASRLQQGAAGGDEAASALRRHAKTLRALARAAAGA